MTKQVTRCLLYTSIWTCFFFINCASDKKNINRRDDIPVTLTLFHFNDGESKLLNAGKGMEEFGGIARLASIVKKKRDEIDIQESHVHITVSSGDNFLAGPVFNVSLQKGVPYYDAIAFDLLSVHAVTLGNHDFDFGPDVLANFIESFHQPFPLFLSSNLDFSDEPALQKLVEKGRIVKSAVIKRSQHTFGFIGLTSTNLPAISSPRKVKVKKDIISCVQQEVNTLENRGINKIILISHLQGINKDIDLISKIHGVDIVVAGGGDELLANRETALISHVIEDKEIIAEKIYGPYPLLRKDAKNKTVPIVTTCGEYRYVGLLQVKFNATGNIINIHENSGPVRVVGDSYKNGITPDQAIVDQVEIPLTIKLKSMNNTIIGVSKVNLDGNRLEIRAKETPLGNLLADALLWTAQREYTTYNSQRPEIAIINGGSIRTGLVAGNISELDVFNICPFSSFITIVENVTPRELKVILENAYSRVGADGSIEGVSGTGRFAQIAGFQVEYNPIREPGRRVKQVVLNDSNLIVSNYRIAKNAPSVHLATIGFLARGGDECDVGSGRQINIGKTHRQALIEYIKAPKSMDGMDGVISKSAQLYFNSNRIVRTNK